MMLNEGQALHCHHSLKKKYNLDKITYVHLNRVTWAQLVHTLIHWTFSGDDSDHLDSFYSNEFNMANPGFSLVS